MPGTQMNEQLFPNHSSPGSIRGGVEGNRKHVQFLFKGAMKDIERAEQGEELVQLPEDNEMTAAESTPLVHLYRAEVSRMTAYRVRMDTTTNWAVSTMAALVAFSLGTAAMPHYFFVLIFALQLVFLAMEARRYVYYSLVRHRCRLMERGMYSHILVSKLPSADWRRELRRSYTEDATLMSFWTAVLFRLQRNYIYMLLVVVLGWTFKLITISQANHTPFPIEYFIPIAGTMVIMAVIIVFVFKTPRLDV